MPKEIRSEVEAVMAEKDRLEKENRLLSQQLRLIYLLKFGRRSEKLSDNQLELLDQEASFLLDVGARFGGMARK